ncbi:hypothetical protein IFM89_032849 [Coptis chinensis]|uniref:Uncharacterized protein n=1 Tax=Coptis chinensis TaxID=261450 RepID=A0A835II62_9MAGN|nr:hypothetical protein IFM89_032849 [Coptis chinensis]
MSSILETTGTHQVEIRYVNGDTPGIVEENFELYFPEHGNLSLEEVLQDQESVYLSFQANRQSERANASASSVSTTNQEETGGHRQIGEEEGESLQVSNVKSQLELDEALAMTLQELEHQLGSASLNGDTETEVVNVEVNSVETSTQVVREDNVDPDNMTYEEILSLGEEIGTESRGLSDEFIAFLPSYKYKTAFFKKEKHEEHAQCAMRRCLDPDPKKG